MAGNIVEVRVTIRGFKPLLWHKFGPEALPLEQQEKKGVPGNNPEEWMTTYLMTEDGQLYLEPSYLFACARDGGRSIKRGRSSLTRWIASTLQVVEDRVLVDRYMPGELTRDPDQPVYLDVRGVRNPNSRGGSRNIRYRVAASPGWTATFHIMFDKTVISRPEMHSALIDAGKLCGVGDGRAIGFGRFTVEEFEEIAEEQTA